MNSDLGYISIWSKQWLVNFNPQKTKAMVFFNISSILINYILCTIYFVKYRKHTSGIPTQN